MNGRALRAYKAAARETEMLEVAPDELEKLEEPEEGGGTESRGTPVDDPFAPCPTCGRAPAVPIKSLQDRFEYLNKVREEKRRRDRERRFAKLPTLEKLFIALFGVRPGAGKSSVWPR